MVLYNGRVQKFKKNVDEFTMFDGPDNINYSGFSCEAIRGNNENTPLARLFFSPHNIEMLQNGIRYMVYKESGGRHVIGRQSEIELKIVMRSVFFEHAKHLKYDVVGQTRNLNAIVIKDVVPKIITEVDMYERYKRDVTMLPEPMPRSLNMSTKGSKTLELKRL
jgi:hypothetical protein